MQYHSVNSWADKAFRWMSTLVVVSVVLPLQINSYCIAAAFVAWLFTDRWKGYWRGIKQNSVAQLILLLYFLYVLGLTYTTNMEAGWREVSEFKLSLLVLPVLFGSFKASDRRFFQLLPRVFYLTLAFTILAALLAALNNYLTADQPTHWMQFFTYVFLANAIGFQPIYLSLYCVFASFCLYHDLFFDEQLRWRGIKNRFTRVWSLVLAFVFFAAIVMLSSRMEILVYATTFSALAFIRAWLYGKWKKSLLTIVFMLGLGLTLILVNQTNKARFQEMIDLQKDYTQTQWGGRSIRIEKWKNTFQTWWHAPVMGVGTGDVMDDLMDTYRKNDFQLALQHHYNPHNQYLQTLLAIGIPGFLTLVAWMLLMIYRAVEKRHALMLAFALVTSMSMLTESMLERQRGIVFIALFGCIFASFVVSKPRETGTE